ncbi:MAG: NAD(P)-dependent oxidoreductase [Candidatus Aenigmarchaeota archaeon]|nr:NAD(P)-dependent oxidoreductase [Candidatus Aenigmarchaeota archaeon]
MRILVVGGTGFLGKHLLVRLLRERHEITVFSRKMEDELIDKVLFVTGDVRDKKALEKAFPCDVVYHLAAELDESNPEMYEINVEGTRNVVDLCIKHRTKHLVFMGSCGALGDAVIAEEDGGYNPKTLYEKSKAEAEKLVTGSGVPCTIVRAPVIIGPNYIWYKIFQAAKNRYPIIGSGENKFHLAYIKDAADMLNSVKGNSRAAGRIFHVATKDVPAYKEVYTMMCEEMKTKMTGKHVPVIAMKFAASVYEGWCRVRGKRPSLTMMRSSIERLTRNRRISMNNAKLIGFEPKYDTRTALKETIKYLQMAKQGYSDFEIAEKGLMDGDDFGGKS